MRSRDGSLSASCASLLEAFPGAGGGLIVSRSGLGLHKTIKRPCAVWRFRAGFPEGASRFPGRPAFQKDGAKVRLTGIYRVGRLHIGQLVLTANRGFCKLSRSLGNHRVRQPPWRAQPFPQSLECRGRGRWLAQGGSDRPIEYRGWRQLPDPLPPTFPLKKMRFPGHIARRQPRMAVSRLGREAPGSFGDR